MAGREIAAAYITLIPTTKGIATELQRQIGQPVDEASRRASRALEEGLGSGASRGAHAAGLAISAIGSAAILSGLNRAKDAASGLQQAVGGTAAVFRDASGELDTFAEGAAEAVGLSERAAREATTRVGSVLTGLEFSTDQAADSAIRLTQIGADLAATVGGTTTDAVHALGRALVGEFDPLEAFSVSIRQADINLKAVELGLASSTSAVDSNARAQATLALITERAAFAQGRFAEESDQAAGAAQISAAKQENAAADLGEALLPIYAKISETVGSVADVFAALPSPVQTGILALAGVAAVAGPVSNLVGLYRSLHPASAAVAAAIDASSRSVSNSADAVSDLYTGTNKASTAMRGLALAGGALAAIGIAATLKEISDASTGLHVDIEEAARATTDELLSGFERLGGVGSRVARDAFRDLAEGGEAGAGAALALRDAVAAAGVDVAELDQILSDTADANARFTARTEGGSDALAAFGTETDAAAAAAADAEGPVETLGAAADGVASGFAALNDQLDENIGHLRDVFDLATSDTEAQLAFRDTLRSIADSTASVADGTLAGQERVDEFTRLLISGRDDALDYAEALLRTGSSSQEAADAANAMIGELFDVADQAGLTADETAALRAELELLPDQVETRIESNIGLTLATALELRDALASLGGLAVVDVNTTLRGPHAHTGPIGPGAWLVGEDGPEILTLGPQFADGFMLGAADTAELSNLHPAAGNASVTLNVQGDPDAWTLALLKRAAKEAALEVQRDQSWSYAGR